MLRFPCAILNLLICTTLLFSAGRSTVMGQVPREELARLADEIQKALEASPASETKVAPATQPSHSRVLLNTLRSASEGDDLVQIESALQQLAAYLDSKALRAECARTAAQIRVLREAKEKQAIDEIETTLKRATEAILSAQRPADLDATLQALGKARSQLSSHASRAEHQIEPAIQFVTQWQNYLAQKAAGDKKAAEGTLDRIIGMNQIALLPRSEILARRYGRPPTPTPTLTPAPTLSATPTPRPHGEHFADVLEELKTPEDLVPVMTKLVEWATDPSRVSPEEMPGLQNTIKSITLLVRAFQEFQAGLPVVLELLLNDPARSEPLGALLSPVRGQLVKLVLGRYVGAPPELKIKPDEGAQEFLDRVIADAVSRADFMLATRARAAQQLLREGKTEVPKERTQAELFINGYNQERAGQFALAVTSYQKALSSGTEIVPPKAIGERLARIKTEYPTEFEEGLQAFLNPHFPTPPPGWVFPNNVTPGKSPSPSPSPGPRKAVPPLIVPNPKATPMKLATPVLERTRPPE